MKPQFAQVSGKASPRRSTAVLPIAWSSVTRSSQPYHSSCPQNGHDGRAPRLRKKSKIGGFAIIRLATVPQRTRRDPSGARPGWLDRRRDGEGEGRRCSTGPSNRVEAHAGDAERGARLLGVSESVAESIAYALPSNREWQARIRSLLSDRLGEAPLRLAMTEGRLMTSDDGVEYAVGAQRRA